MDLHLEERVFKSTQEVGEVNTSFSYGMNETPIVALLPFQSTLLCAPSQEPNSFTE